MEFISLKYTLNMKYKFIAVAVLLLSLFSVAFAEISIDYGGSHSIRLREGWNLVTVYSFVDILFKNEGTPKDVSAIFVYDRYAGEDTAYPQREQEKLDCLLLLEIRKKGVILVNMGDL